MESVDVFLTAHLESKAEIMSTRSHQFARILPALFVGVVVGTASGYFMAKHGQNLKIPTTPHFNDFDKSAGTRPANPPSLNTAGTPSNEDADNEAKLAQLQKLPVETNEEAAPSASPIAYSTPSPEVIAKISDKTITPGVVQDKQVDEKTHEIYTTETLPDGSTASRDYREDGSLKSEDVKMPDGSELERSFFEAGGTKAANFHNPDGSITSAAYDSTGVPSEMMTTYPDHSTVFNEYDDHGKVIGVWQHFPDGRTEPFEGGEVTPNNP